MQLQEAMANPTLKAMHSELFNEILSRGTYNGTAEFLHKAIFSTMNITAADVTAARKTWRLFDPSVAYTVDETNQNGPQLPKGQHLSAYTLQMEAYRTAGDAATPAMVRALITFLMKSYCSYNAEGKSVQWDGSLARIAGLSIAALGEETATIAPIETFRAISNGNFSLKIPLVIEELTTFFLVVQTPLTITSDLAGWSVRLFLDGGYVRGL